MFYRNFQNDSQKSHNGLSPAPQTSVLSQKVRSRSFPDKTEDHLSLSCFVHICICEHNKNSFIFIIFFYVKIALFANPIAWCVLGSRFNWNYKFSLYIINNSSNIQMHVATFAEPFFYLPFPSGFIIYQLNIIKNILSRNDVNGFWHVNSSSHHIIWKMRKYSTNYKF